MAPRTSALVATLAAARCAAFTPTQDENMNGVYEMSKTPGAPEGPGFPAKFKDYPGGVEYFDVYHGPITTTYGQVWWTSTSNDIPPEVVQRFKGKAMAIVGLEIDQVRKTPNGDVSLPISAAYNHHHDTAVVGTNSHLEEMDRMDERVPPHGQYMRLDKGKAWVPVEHKASLSGVPTSAMFSDANGGEYRKSYHVYPPPFAMMVESPERLAGSPMQIDTWNRDHMDLNTTNPKFVSGPVPKHVLAPTSGPDAIYSGLLECPLTSRIQKVYDADSANYNDTFSPQIFSCASTAACEHSPQTAADCFAAVAALKNLGNATLKTLTVDDPSGVPGCTVAVATDAKQATATFNSAASAKGCAGGSGDVVGAAASLVTVGLNVSRANIVTITLAGPADVWFGVGFDATAMADKPYAITVDGSTGKVTERRLSDHDHGNPQGTVLSQSVSVVSNTVTGATRHVVLTRALKGATSQHFTFDPLALSLNIIDAIGSTPTISYHKQKTTTTMYLWPTALAPVAVCTVPAAPFGQGSGKMRYLPTGEEVGFPKNRCNLQAYNILNNRNPTCDIRAYVGGLQVCHHGWTLLDAEQPIPWQDQPLVYYKKFRIYYQEYNSSFHVQVSRNDWGIGADGDHAEYDVPQCPPGTPTKDCTHTIEGVWQPFRRSEPWYLVKAHFHCHAPTCLRVELWNNDTGALLCRQEPIYGGTGKIDQDRFDEPGYLATPPCLWGRPEDGLEAPPRVDNVNIRAVAVTNNTYGHHGEMALPEVSVAPSRGF